MIQKSKQVIKNFLTEYMNDYPDYVQEDFKKIFDGYTINNDIINQIYCYLSLVDIKETDYYLFFKYLKENDFLANNMLEVCCGAIPVLSDIIDKNNYQITALDKEIVIKNYRFKIVEKEFNELFDLNKYDTVIAFRPCMATEIIIKKCLTNQIPFCIYLCNCALFPQEPYKIFTKNNWSNEKWIQYLEYVIKKYNIHSMKIKIDYNTHLFDSAPIISAK